MSRQSPKPVWVVVNVWGGIPASVEVFKDRAKAESLARKLRAQMRPD